MPRLSSLLNLLIVGGSICVAAQANGRDLYLVALRAPASEPGQRVLSLPSAPAVAERVSLHGNGDAFTTTVQIANTTDTTPLHAHYSRELLAAGWSAEGAQAGIDGQLSVSRFKSRSATGEPLTGVLLVKQHAGKSALVSVRVLRDKSQRPFRSRSSSALGRAGTTLGRAGGGGAGTRNQRPALPAGFPADLLPNPAVIRSVLPGTSPPVVLAEARGMKPSDVPGLVRELARKGWQPQMPSPHGFRASWPSVIVCRGEQLATMSFLPESNDVVTIRTELTSGPGSCPRRAQPQAFLGAPLLTLPPTASGTGGGWGGGTNELHSQMRVAATIGDLSAHFSAELNAGGWPVSGAAAGSGIAIRRFRGATIDGEPLDGVLMLVSLPDGSVDCWFQIVR